MPNLAIADLGKVLGLSGKSLIVTVGRLVKAGVLLRLRRNTYTVFTTGFTRERVAAQTYMPSYLSFESALSRFGILSQLPYTQTFATSRPSKQMMLGEQKVEFSHIKADLYWGFVQENDLYVAEPEKALLDQLYLVSKGLRSLNIQELDLRTIDKEKFLAYTKRFPSVMHKLVAEVDKCIGTSAITSKSGGRVAWNASAIPYSFE